jgi:hypothetical protein
MAVTRKRNRPQENAYQLNYRRRHRGQDLIRHAKRRAKDRNLPFDLDDYEEKVEERIQRGICEVTGLPLNLEGGRTWDSPSIDRIVPKMGYLYSNIRIVSNAANGAMGDWGEQKILDMAKGILAKRQERSNDLSRRLAKRLKDMTEHLGSTLYDLTWDEQVTHSGHVIPRQRASALPTSAKDCIGALGWPTPTVQLGWRHGYTEGTMHPGTTLTDAAQLAGWPTPAARDWKSGEASQETLDQNARPLSKIAILSGWQTPRANDAEKRGNPSERVGNGLVNDALLARLTASGEGPIGFVLGPNGWETHPASGQLNPALSRWLQSIPAIWCECAIRASRSLKARKRASSASAVTGTQS